MQVKLLVLSPFELPFSNKRGRYTVGDSIYFNLKSADEKAVLIKVLSDVRYRNIVQPTTKLPEEITQELHTGNPLLDEGRVPQYETVKVSDQEKKKLNQLLQPPTLVEEKKKVVVESVEQTVEPIAEKPVVEEEPAVEEEVSLDEEREAFKADLQNKHWATVRKLAEETFGLTYAEFDKSEAIEDILKVKFG